MFKNIICTALLLAVIVLTTEILCSNLFGWIYHGITIYENNFVPIDDPIIITEWLSGITHYSPNVSNRIVITFSDNVKETVIVMFLLSSSLARIFSFLSNPIIFIALNIFGASLISGYESLTEGCLPFTLSAMGSDGNLYELSKNFGSGFLSFAQLYLPKSTTIKKYMFSTNGQIFIICVFVAMIFLFLSSYSMKLLLQMFKRLLQVQFFCYLTIIFIVFMYIEINTAEIIYILSNFITLFVSVTCLISLYKKKLACKMIVKSLSIIFGASVFLTRKSLLHPKGDEVCMISKNAIFFFVICFVVFSIPSLYKWLISKKAISQKTLMKNLSISSAIFLISFSVQVFWMGMIK